MAILQIAVEICTERLTDVAVPRTARLRTFFISILVLVFILLEPAANFARYYGSFILDEACACRCGFENSSDLSLECGALRNKCQRWVTTVLNRQENVTLCLLTLVCPQ